MMSSDTQAVGLRAHRVDLAVHLLKQEIELAAARLDAVGQRDPVRHVAAEALELLADVGSRRHAHDLLRHRRLVRLQLGAQLADALGHALLHRRAPLVGGDGDALDQIGDRRAPAVEIAAERIALPRAHRVEIDQRLLDGLMRLRRHRSPAF